MPQLHPQIGEIYKHFKGKLYQVTAIGTHSETGEQMVVYQALYGDFATFVRPYEQFVGEVDFEKYPACTSRFRFTYVPREELAASASQQMPQTVQTTGTNQMPQTAQTTGTNQMPQTAQTTNVEKAPQTAQASPIRHQEQTIQDLMLDFLDERDFEKKEKILSELGAHKDLSDGIIDNLAAALDYVIDEGPLDVRFAQLRTCVRTRARFENTRLRG